MAIRKVSYCYVKVPSRAGQAVKILGALKDAGVSLLAFSGFPIKGRKSQVDLVSHDIAGIRQVAKEQGWRLSKVKRGFHVTGADRVGAAHSILARLAKKNINVTAVDAITTAKKQYGMILWVKPNNYRRATVALNAK